MFKDRFVQILQERDLTAYKVGKEAHISQGLMNEYKNGVKTPSSNNLKKIADYLGCTTDYLLGKTDDPAAQKKEPGQVTQLSADEEDLILRLRQADPEKRAAILALIK